MEETTSLEPLLTIGEVAKLLGVSKAKAYGLIYDGEIRALRMGRCVRVAPSTLKQFIDRLTVGAA